MHTYRRALALNASTLALAAAMLAAPAAHAAEAADAAAAAAVEVATVVEHLSDLTEFDHINPTLSPLHLRNETLRAAQTTCELDLRDARSLTN